MARSEFIITVSDSAKAKQLINAFLHGQKAKQEIYQQEEIVWRFGNGYLKVEYGSSEVKLFGWLSDGVSGKEGELNSGIFSSIFGKPEVEKMIEQIQELLKRECSVNVDDLLNRAMDYEEKKQYDKSFPLYIKAAELGNARAQNQVGLAYIYEQGTRKDYAKAIYWLEKAAAQNIDVLWSSFFVTLLANKIELFCTNVSAVFATLDNVPKECCQLLTDGGELRNRFILYIRCRGSKYNILCNIIKGMPLRGGYFLPSGFESWNRLCCAPGFEGRFVSIIGMGAHMIIGNICEFLHCLV